MAHIYFGDRGFDAQLIVFDKDGTLLDFNAVWRPLFVAAVDSLLAPIAEGEAMRPLLYRTLGFHPETGRFDIHAPFATAANATIATIAATVLYQQADGARSWDECEQLVRAHFAPVLAATPGPDALVPTTDLPRLFSALRAANVHIALVTSDDTAPSLAALDLLGLRQYVEFIVGGDGHYARKPAPDALWAAGRHFGVSMEQTVMVGDSATDMRMGMAAGVGLRVAVLTGPGGRVDLEPYADVVLSSIGEIEVGCWGE